MSQGLTADHYGVADEGQGASPKRRFKSCTERGSVLDRAPERIRAHTRVRDRGKFIGEVVTLHRQSVVFSQRQ